MKNNSYVKTWYSTGIHYKKLLLGACEITESINMMVFFEDRNDKNSGLFHF